MDEQCPKCGGTLIETAIDLPIYIKNDVVGILKDVPVFSCDNCSFDAFVLKVEVDADGIYLGGENG